MRILGIDPGLRRTGFGVVDADGMRLRVASGTIVVPPSLALSERLKVILDNLRQVAQETRPDVAALEIVFLNTNPASTLLLGQARARAVRAGRQRAGRARIHRAADQESRGRHRPRRQGAGADDGPAPAVPGRHAGPDSADALACAICHAHAGPLQDKLGRLGATLGGGQTRLRNGRLVG